MTKSAVEILEKINSVINIDEVEEKRKLIF